MSAVLGVFLRQEDPAPGLSETIARRMMTRMARRGTDRVGLWREGRAVLAVGRYGWELAPGFSGPVLVVHDGELAVAADATLYLRDDLRRAVAARGVRPVGQTPSHLILAAYRAWGVRCAEHLDGDFAFVLHDRRHQRVLAVCGHSAKRPLHWTELRDGTRVVASTIGAILRHPLAAEDLDPITLAEHAAGYVSDAETTCFRDVKRVEPGTTLVLGPNGVREAVRHWQCPTFECGGGAPFDAATEQLQALLRESVAERMAPDATAVWMSGGYDSTAVFGSGMGATRDGVRGGALLPVSVSYPPGDPGCEDHYIQAVAAHWGQDVRWVHAYDVPVLGPARQRAVERDEPLAHPFEEIMRACARAGRDAGARVALDGTGGDALFLASSAGLSDLLLRGRWLTFGREWRAQGFETSSFRTFFRWAVQPAMGPMLHRVARMLRGGRALAADTIHRAPRWVNRELAKIGALDEPVRLTLDRRSGERATALESRMQLTHPLYQRYMTLLAEAVLAEGVELRSAFMDRRLIALAAQRPLQERFSGGETKRLLRHAMRGLVPDSVLAARQARTGLPGTYFASDVRRAFANGYATELQARHATTLGVLDADRLASAVARFRAGADGDVSQLYLTVQLEIWLSERRSTERASGTPDPEWTSDGNTDRGPEARRKLVGHM